MSKTTTGEKNRKEKMEILGKSLLIIYDIFHIYNKKNVENEFKIWYKLSVIFVIVLPLPNIDC